MPEQGSDLILFAATVALLVIGIIMVFSASYTRGLSLVGDPYHFIKRQVIWAAIGLVVMAFMQRIDYHVYRPLALPALVVACLLLVLVLVVGNEILGARRWLDFGPIQIQPSELAKLAVIDFLAALAAYQRDGMRRFWTGIVLPLGVVGAVCLLIVAEPDLGTALAIMGTSLLMLYASGVRLGYLAGVGLAGIPVLVLLIWLEPYRMRRITAFLNPWADPLGAGWNVIQSLLAIGSGGLFGLGLGESRQKFSYLPEQHTDFIFSILAEELGFIGTTVVVLLFAILAWRGFRVALKAPDLFGTVLAVGLTAKIVLQAALNIGVVTGSLPVTGVTLPLISFGGSSLVVTLAGIGVLLNISKSAR